MNEQDKQAFKVAVNKWHTESGGKDLAEYMFQAGLAQANKEIHQIKSKLVEIHSLLSSIGDTDPYVDDDMSDEEIAEEYPEFWATAEIAKLIGGGPWDQYMTTKEKS